VVHDRTNANASGCFSFFVGASVRVGEPTPRSSSMARQTSALSSNSLIYPDAVAELIDAFGTMWHSPPASRSAAPFANRDTRQVQ
jgi:hypothetical protein